MTMAPVPRAHPAARNSDEALSPATFGDRRIAVDPHHLLLRLLEMVPGLLTWGTLIGLGALAFIVPRWIAIFLILYDLYWLIRAVYIGIHLIASYRLLRRHRGVDWRLRLRSLADRTRALEDTAERIAELQRTLHGEWTRGTRRERGAVRRRIWHEREFLRDLQRFAREGTDIVPWERLLHVVIIPTYREPFSVLETTLTCLKNTDFPKERMWVVLACEERAGAEVQRVRERVETSFATTFGRLIITVHPDGIPGEKQVKSANATWAGREVQRRLDREGIAYDDVVISNFDSDTCVQRDYFAYLTYVYATTPERTRASYQPLPLYNNNIWDAPAFTRVIATNSSFWQMIEAVRPDRLVTFSSHSMSFRALVDAGFWQVDIVSEDSRIFWQCFLRYEGAYKTVPLSTTVSMDATHAPTLWRTFVSQYRQKRRWAWGIENFPFLAHAFLHQPRIPLRQRLRALFIMLEGNHSWATSAIIIAGLGWIPVFFGGAEFHTTILAYNLPFVTRTLMSMAMGGLVVSMTLTLLLLPPPPLGTPKRKYVYMVLQWALVPVIASVLGSAPAIDAQTRLMIGRPLGFWITEKVRARDPRTAMRRGVPSAGAAR